MKPPVAGGLEMCEGGWVETPKFIDAKFKVVRPKRQWRLTFDWRNFLIISGLCVAAGLARLLG